MADTKNKFQGPDDHISHNGSISSGKFAFKSDRSNQASMREQEIREQYDISGIVSGQKRFNKLFHNYRLIVVMMGGMSVGLMLLLRYTITISMLRMVNQTHMYLEEHPDKTVEDFLDEGYSLGGEFNWNNEIVQIIMSWYMVTYTLPQMAAAKLSAKMGCRLSVPISLSICAISSLLTPHSAYLGWKYVVALRMLNGLGACAVVPMMLNLIEKWMRYDEISYGLSMAEFVVAIVSALTPLFAGYLSAIHWSLAFYVPGAFTLIFCALWLILIADSPEKSKFISEKELLYMHRAGEKEKKLSASSPPSTMTDTNNNTCDETKKHENNSEAIEKRRQEEELEYQAESWTQIFGVPSFYAYMIMWVFYQTAYNAFTFVLPTYLRQFLKVKVAQNGFYCFIIQTGTILSVVWPHPLLRILQKYRLSITQARIVAHAICCFIVAVTWCYVGALHEAQLFLFFMNRVFQPSNDIILTGSLMSNYAKAGLSSVAFAVVNTVGHLAAAPISTLIGWALDYTNQSRGGWCWIFCGMGISQLVMFAIFAIFVDSNPIKFKKRQDNAEGSRL